MNADEKKNLVTAKLAELVRRELVEGTTDHVEAAVRIMEGREGGVGLWEVMAPMIDSLAVRDAVEIRLRGHEGMPLTATTINDILRSVDRVLDAMVGTEPTRRPTSGSFRSTGLWGGRVVDEQRGGEG